VLISSVAAPDREGTANANWSAPQWEEWQAEARSLEAVAGYRWTFNFLILDDGSESLEGMWISPEYFDVTGLEPQIGRSFHEVDATVETPGVIIGHELWQRRFGGDPAVLGQTIRMSRMPPLTVVGVMPPDVRFLPSPGVEQEPNYDLNARVDFWQPMPTQLRERGIWDVVALLKPGATVADAQAELTVLAARQAEADPNLEGVTAELEALTSVLNQDGERILWPLLVSAALVLLISCGNAAALLLVRGLQRQHEYGLRSAVGAGRSALFRHVIAESLALSLLGGALGVRSAATPSRGSTPSRRVGRCSRSE
jgi:putative ABC transport system permease protein